jgi:hypothetical protein
VREESLPVPADCTDGMLEAFFARPEKLLEEPVRRAQSSWSFLPPGVEARAVEALARDLRSGAWDRELGHLRRQASFDGSLRLLIAEP